MASRPWTSIAEMNRPMIDRNKPLPRNNNSNESENDEKDAQTDRDPEKNLLDTTPLRVYATRVNTCQSPQTDTFTLQNHTRNKCNRIDN